MCTTFFSFICTAACHGCCLDPIHSCNQIPVVIVISFASQLQDFD
jgi:hypothetical protein